MYTICRIYIYFFFISKLNINNLQYGIYYKKPIKNVNNSMHSSNHMHISRKV